MPHQHNHGHNHNHMHSHGASKNIAVAFFLNFFFAIFELFGGIYTNSVAITSDAIHDFGDSISLGMAWYFEKISKRKSTKSLSYGYKRFSILGAVINSLVLLIGSIIVLYETVPRLFSPVQSDVKGMLLFAVIGIIVNGFAAIRLIGGKSINERAVSLHLLEDVLGWIAILIGSGVMYFVDAPIIDPILSIGITLFVLYNVFKNLRSIVKVILQAVPEGIEIDQIAKSIKEIKGVKEIHDLHIWTMDNNYNILTIHVVIPKDTPIDTCQLKGEIRELLHTQEIEHSTIEIEKEGENCSMKNCCN